MEVKLLVDRVFRVKGKEVKKKAGTVIDLDDARAKDYLKYRLAEKTKAKKK